LQENPKKKRMQNRVVSDEEKLRVWKKNVGQGESSGTCEAVK